MYLSIYTDISGQDNPQLCKFVKWILFKYTLFYLSCNMFTMASSSTVIASHSFPSPVGWAKCKRMARRLMNQDKDSLIDEVKSARSKQSRNSLHPLHQQANVQASPGRQGLGIHKASWGDKCHNHHLPFFLFPLRFYCWTLHDKEYDRGQSGSVVLAMSPPNLSSASASSLRGQSGKQKKPWQRAGTAQQWLEHWCIIEGGVDTSPKHGTLWVTM